MPANDVAATPATKEGPGGRFVGTAGIVTGLGLMLSFSVLLLYSMLKLWPHNSEQPRPAAIQGATVQQAGATTAPTVPTGGAAKTAGDAAGASARPPVAATDQPRVDGAAVPAPRGMAVLDRNGYLVCAPFDSTYRKIPIATADTARGADCIVWLGMQVPVWIEQRLFVIVLLAGALGATLHAVRSLTWYIGNRQLVWSWLAFYLALPLVGSLLGGSFYMIVRGGFFSSGSIQATNTFGFAALGVLIGMFTTPAVLKLKEVAETVLAKPQPGADTAPTQAEGGARGAAAAGPPTIASVERQRRSAGAPRDALLIKGTAFASAATVQINGQARPAEVQSAQAILVSLTDDDTKRIDAGGDFDIIVANPGGAASKPFDFA